MAARNLYPAPECPKCGKFLNRVKNTYYTEDGRICRTRQCDFCEWKWWTLQYPELNLDPGKYKLQIQRWGSPGTNPKEIKIVQL